MSNRKKKCPVPDCAEKITLKNSYCKSHFIALPSDIRSNLAEARRIGNGMLLIEARKKAEQFFEEKGNTMVNGSSKVADVILESRNKSQSGKAQAFFQGDIKHNEETGQDQEVWIWLPISQIEVEELGNGSCEVTMPEWLAKEKGLI